MSLLLSKPTDPSHSFFYPSNHSNDDMVLKQKGKPQKGKKPLRGAPKQFSDPREFPDEPLYEPHSSTSCSESEEVESGSESESSSSDSSVEHLRTALKSTSIKPDPKPNPVSSAPKSKAASTASAGPSGGQPRELTRREREAIQKEQARQHYLKMKEKEDAARLAIIRKQREEAAAKHAEEQRGKCILCVC